MDDKSRERVSKLEMKRKQQRQSLQKSSATITGWQVLFRISHCYTTQAAILRFGNKNSML